MWKTISNKQIKEILSPMHALCSSVDIENSESALLSVVFE
jgi:hypothetical protein